MLREIIKNDEDKCNGCGLCFQGSALLLLASKAIFYGKIGFDYENRLIEELPKLLY